MVLWDQLFESLSYTIWECERNFEMTNWFCQDLDKKNVLQVLSTKELCTAFFILIKRGEVIVTVFYFPISNKVIWFKNA